MPRITIMTAEGPLSYDLDEAMRELNSLNQRLSGPLEMPESEQALLREHHRALQTALAGHTAQPPSIPSAGTTPAQEASSAAKWLNEQASAAGRGGRPDPGSYWQTLPGADWANAKHRPNLYMDIPGNVDINKFAIPGYPVEGPGSLTPGRPTTLNIPQNVIQQYTPQPYNFEKPPPEVEGTRRVYRAAGPQELAQYTPQNAEDVLRQSLQGLTPPSPQQSGPAETMPSAVQTPKQVEMQTGLAGVVGGSRNVTDALNMGMSDRSRVSAGSFAPQQGSEPFGSRVASGVRGILGWHNITAADPIVGHGRAIQETPGGTTTMRFTNPQTGEVTVPESVTSMLQQTAAGSLVEAGERFGGMSDVAARAINVRQHVYKSVMGVIDNLEKQAKAEAAGGNLVDAQKTKELAQRARVIATDMVGSGLKAIEEELGPGGKGLAFDLGKGIKMGPKGLSDLLSSDALSDTAKEQIRQQAAEADNAAFGKRQTFTFQTGGGGTGSIGLDPSAREGGGGGGRGGIWGGEGMGPLMYGAYIARRFWGYTGAPVMRATEEYAQTMGALAPMMTGEVPTSGPGALYARRENAQFMLGAAGYNLIGGALGLTSQAMTNPAVATATAGTGLFGGGALAASILGRAVGDMGAGAGIGRLRIGASGIGGLLGGAAGIVGGAGMAYTGLVTAQQIYAGQGYDRNLFETAEAAGQTLGQAGLSAINFAAASAGVGAPYAAATQALLGTAWGEKLTGPIGTKIAGSEIATSQQIAEASNRLNISAKSMPTLMGVAYQATGSRDWTSQQNSAYIQAVNKMVQTEGMTESAAAAAMGGYASALGYKPGEAGFGQAGTTYAGMSIAQRATEMQEAQGAASGAEIARQYMSRDAISDPSLRAAMRGIQTGAGRASAAQYIGALTSAGVGANISTGISTQLFGGVDRGEYTMNQAQFAAGMMGNLAPYMTSDQLIRMGGGMTQMMANLSVGQQAGIGAMWSGDIAGMSTAAGAGNLGGWAAWNDATGRQMYQTDVGAAMAQARSYDQFTGTNFSGLGGIGDMRFANMSGSQRLQASMNASGYGLQMSSRAATTIDQGYRGLTGMRALGLQTADIQYGAQMASAGLQIEGINARREMLWGSGSWDNPSANSLWGLENRQRGIQWSSTQQDWAAQQWRMQSQNQAAIQQENLSQERMGAQRAFQTYQFGYERSGALLQRGWAREDYQYQDQMRGLQFGWGMEDINEQIRMSSGRQRRQLVKQRGRMVTTQNLEEEQVDEQRSRQDQLWAREDEQFQKRVEYSETINELDDKQFELTKSRREELFVFETEQFERHKQEQIELHAIQEQIIQLNRKYQAEELDRSERAAKIQMGAAAAAKEYNDLLAFQEDLWEESSGHFKTMSEQERARLVMKEVVKMTEAINDVDVGKLRYIIKFLEMELKGL